MIRKPIKPSSRLMLSCCCWCRCCVNTNIGGESAIGFSCHSWFILCTAGQNEQIDTIGGKWKPELVVPRFFSSIKQTKPTRKLPWTITNTSLKGWTHQVSVNAVRSTVFVVAYIGNKIARLEWMLWRCFEHSNLRTIFAIVFFEVISLKTTPFENSRKYLTIVPI